MIARAGARRPRASVDEIVDARLVCALLYVCMMRMDDENVGGPTFESGDIVRRCF